MKPQPPLRLIGLTDPAHLSFGKQVPAKSPSILQNYHSSSSASSSPHLGCDQNVKKVQRSMWQILQNLNEFFRGRRRKTELDCFLPTKKIEQLAAFFVIDHKSIIQTHHCQQLLDLLDGPFKFQLCPVLWVLHGDEHVQLVVQVLPVWLPAVLLLLQQQLGQLHSTASASVGLVRAFLLGRFFA